MKIKLIIGIVIITGLLILIAYIMTVQSDFWEEPAWDDDDEEKETIGTWGTKIEICYEDGTIDTLKTILDMFYEHKRVDFITYKLAIKATGTGYEYMEVDLSEFYINTYIKQDNAIFYEEENLVGTIESVSLDGEWNDLYEISIFSQGLEEYDIGSYTLEFEITGLAKIHGVPDGEWIDMDNPTSKYITFSVKDENGNGNGNGEKWIDIVLGSEGWA